MLQCSYSEIRLESEYSRLPLSLNPSLQLNRQIWPEQNFHLIKNSDKPSRIRLSRQKIDGYLVKKTSRFASSKGVPTPLTP